MQFGKKPVIGINADFVEAKGEKEAFSYVWAGYYESILRAGGIPVILPPMQNEDELRQILNHLDGIVLTGGGDLDSRRDGYVLHSTVRPMAVRREDFDRMLMRVVAEIKLPVLAIGAGMQLLNVTMGGSLFFHIPIDLPKAMPHFDRHSPIHRHTLDVVPGTLMEKIYGDSEIRVCSRHHMAINDVAPGFIVSAKSPDGVIEAIESEIDDWFVIATQFHPESASATALDLRIFEEFIEAVGGVPYEFSLVA
ncbi:MAG: gamma-glutamyl-gamma-aminobutyrate hydrolase family protein [Thermoguttaceae bacterium]|nr:gamma-glutamyl-gamma-aminobutyrate hydrolase family protein [Thermoguttaceae bacterium]